MYLNASDNTLKTGERLVLKIAQRTHHFSIWWITYTLVQVPVGLLMFHIGATLMESEKYDRWAKRSKKKWCMVLAGFFYELWHHYNDLFYIFLIPHWNKTIVILLLLCFWIPLSLNLGMMLSEGKETSLLDPEGI